MRSRPWFPQRIDPRYRDWHEPPPPVDAEEAEDVTNAADEIDSQQDDTEENE